MRSSAAGSTTTTTPGYKNRNGQVVVHATGLAGTAFGQYIYVLRCSHCSTEYGAIGPDIFQRRCPKCQRARPGLAY